MIAMPYDFLPPPLKPVYIDILSPPEGRLIGGRGKVMDPDKASIDRCVEREEGRGPSREINR